MTLPSSTWGHGPRPAVFLHGFAGAASTFGHLEPLLGDVLHARCIELPGHSGTPVAEGWDEVVEAVGETLAEDTVLVGYSQGARLALAVAQRYPRKLSQLVLESGAAGFRRRRDRVSRRLADDALASLIVARGVEAFVAHWEQLPLFAGLKALNAVDQQALRARRGSHTAQGLAGALRTLGQGAQPDLWPGLQSLRVPTLLITGANDEKYTRLARRMTADLPMAWRVSFRGVGHAPHLECPQAWAEEVRAFLSQAWLSEPQERAP
jgi:2-succinyl-6-hydroxy-2,4-cyclohexadiene-1-carboxylate synthase